MQYEYQTLTWTKGLPTLDLRLNELGSLRWECYQVMFKNEGLHGTYIAFLKRKK